MKPGIRTLTVRTLALFLLLVCGLSGAEQVVLTIPKDETQLGVKSALETRETWLKIIDGAKTSLDIEQFYISDAEESSVAKKDRLDDLIEALFRARDRKVRVRILLEKKFLSNYPEPFGKLGEQPEDKSIAPIETRWIEFKRVGGGIQHAKFLIADEKTFYLGSANFDWRALTHIHEVGVFVENAAVGHNLNAVFDLDWSMGQRAVTVAEPPPERTLRDFEEVKASSGMKLVASPEGKDKDLLPAGMPYSLKEILALIGSTAKRGGTLDIQTMSYSTKPAQGSKRWTQLDDAIRAAAKEGAHVRLLVDKERATDKKGELYSDITGLAGYSGKDVKGTIEVKTVEIPKPAKAYQYAHLIHSKYIVANGKKAWVGTDNLSQDYFEQTRGVGLIFDKADSISTLEEIFEKLWKQPYSVSAK